MSDKTEAVGCLAMIPVTMLHMILIAIVRGFVLMKLWGWFVTDYFNVKPLSIPLALG